MHDQSTNLLKDKVAGDVNWLSSITGMSAEFWEKIRKTDLERKEQGLPPEGIRWIKLGKRRCIYPLAEVEDYFNRKLKEQWGRS